MLSQKLDAQRTAKAKSQAELDKLSLGNQFDKETMTARISKEKIEAGMAGVVEAYAVGSDDPNSSVSGMYNPEDGSLTIRGADGKPLRLPMGTWKTDRPQWSPRHYMTGGGGGGYDPNSHEQRELRKEFAAATNLQRSYGDVFRLLDEAADAGAVGTTGRYGKTASFVNSWVGFAENLATAASGNGSKPSITLTQNGEQYEMTSGADRGKWLVKNKNWLRKNIPGLPRDAAMADRYLALMNEIAYAKAMAAEGGSSRSLSDADHKNAMISIGASLENPATMAKILLSDADRIHERLQDRFLAFDPAARKKLVYQDGQDRYGEVRLQLDPYRTKVGFGTQPTAGGALVPGTVVDGYKFLGGNPADQKSWAKQ
jgi:hypothetical protein